MTPRTARAACLALLLALLPPAAADTIPGAPLMQVFDVQQTQATPGHLALATGGEGELYVGGIEGVLAYDGVDWRLTETTGRSAARALARGADGRIYVGGYDTFGRLARNGGGDLVYEDLLDAAGLRGPQRHVGIVWEVLPMAEGVYFRADRHLHFLPYDGGGAQRWPLPESTRSFFVVAGELWLRQQGVGLCRFRDGRFEPLPGGEAFADVPVAGVLERKDGVLVVANNGLHAVREGGIVPLPGEGSAVVAANRPYTVLGLSDGSVVVGSLDGTVLRLDPDLGLRELVDLGGFAVHALGADREGGVWVATEGNLVRLSMPSPWSFIGQAQGMQGTPHDFEWHEDALWLAGSRGVIRLRQTPRGLDAQHLGWTDFEAYALQSGAGGLLVGVREGLAVLEPGATRPRMLLTLAGQGVYGLLRSDFDPGLVFGLADEELLLLRDGDEGWRVQARLPLEGLSVSGLEETTAGELWFGDTRGPVQRWRVDLASGEVRERTRFGDASGLVVDPGRGTSVFKLDGVLHAISGNAGFRRQGERFLPDDAPPFTLVERPYELSVEETPRGVYAYTSRQLWHRPAGESQWQALNPGAKQATGYANLRVNRDGVLRIATWSGLLQFDPASPTPVLRPLVLGIDVISARSPDGRVLPLPTRSTDGPVMVPPGHSLSLRFGLVSMESGAQFRYQLHGVTAGWSDWTDRDLFIRALAAGDYVLEVEGRTGHQRMAPGLSYRFRVLPYWYEQWWVWAAAGLALLLAGWMLAQWVVRKRTERYLAANRRLEARIAERTRELEELNRQLAELVTEDALTGVANRRALENGLRREWFRCLDQRRPLSVLMIDVDHFKAYNDAHGHLEGDVQLRGIAQRLAQQCDPQRELLARYGGEEFALLLPGVALEEAARRAETIRAAISSSDVGMTVSVGVAGFLPTLQTEPETLLRRADAALYAAKRAGRNRVEVDAG